MNETHELRYSVIIPAYNAEDTLEETLKALNRQTVPRDRYEIIVVDDGSTDNTARIAAQYADKVLEQPNQGPAAARNAGVAVASGDIVLFTDADCAPIPEWIERMTAPFEDPDVVGTKGAYLTRQKAPMARFVQQEYEDRYDRMKRFKYIDFIDTYSAAYRRDVFLSNGGFDTVFPVASVEDQEFSFRLAQKGYKMLFVPEARVYHHHNERLWDYIRRKFSIGYYKALLTRWLPERLFHDTHTPPVLKVQILLIGLLILSLIPAILFPWARWIPAALLGLFYLSSLPFLAKIARRDPAILPYAFIYLPARALALGMGFLAGQISFARRSDPSRKPVLTLRQRLLKRAMDIVGALLLLLITWPIMLITAIAIKLDSPGPILFKQTRIGENGRPFTIYKFRSMVHNADELLPQILDIEHLEVPAYKFKNDPRRTRVGKFIRRWSIDELPQIFNVLKGDMSLVGPRPEIAWLVERYTPEERERLALKPGITGPVQVNGRGDLSFQERLEIEVDYIRNYSLKRDLWILLKTLPAVIKGDGAY
ncbi:MAG: exopolysaccharide biosynthesis polyprenyl glycosylphosphotransferase [Chloroflexi bacterium]|nr:exopolysaccharide biosynthesis polyprenyl glycosylphosphotransferase [Chloroflexota bacterium]